MAKDTVATIVAKAAAAPMAPDFFDRHASLWNAASAWAAWFFGLAAVAINIIGLRFIWKQLKVYEGTLKATADSAAAAASGAAAANEAARISYLASRPWLTFEVERAYLYFNPNQPDLVGCQVNYACKNIGQTPAVQVGLVYKPIPSTAANHSLANEFAALIREAPFQPRPLFPGQEIKEGPSRNFPFPQQPDERFLGFRVIAAILYKASNTGETYWTPLALGLQITDPPTREHFFRRGMGNVECLVMRLADQTPDPT